MGTETLAALKIDPSRKQASQTAPRKRGRRGLYFWLFVGISVLGYLYYDKFLGVSGEGIETSTVVKIYPYEAFAVLTATGYVVPQMQADVATKATGRLEWLEVEEGSRVKKGQLIARLDDQDVIALKEKAAAEVQVSQARLAEAEAELRDAKRSLDRVKNLVKKSVVTEEAYDSALARYEKSVAAADSFRAAIVSAEATLHGAIVDVESTMIRAPFDGVVLRRYANIGDVVAPFSSTIESKGAVLSMADLDTLEVEVDVSESELHKVRVDQPCDIALEALPDKRFRCSVSRIVPTVDKARATVLVRVRFLDLDDRVLPNMSARVAFLSQTPTSDEQNPVVVVPLSAVVKRGGLQVAFLVRKGIVTRVTVETGQHLGSMIEVRRGLSVGDQIVLHPPETLEDGSRINPPSS